MNTMPGSMSSSMSSCTHSSPGRSGPAGAGSRDWKSTQAALIARGRDRSAQGIGLPRHVEQLEGEGGVEMIEVEGQTSRGRGGRPRPIDSRPSPAGSRSAAST